MHDGDISIVTSMIGPGIVVCTSQMFYNFFFSKVGI